jgi:hypothetical protein
VRDLERLLDEERKLRERVASEHGADALALEAEYAAPTRRSRSWPSKSARWFSASKKRPKRCAPRANAAAHRPTPRCPPSAPS